MLCKILFTALLASPTRPPCRRAQNASTFQKCFLLRKRLAVVGVGTAYPVAATMVAASTGDNVAEDKWLTYWSVSRWCS